MSVKSWKEEFYPVPADEVAPEDAIEACIRKWKGFRSSNLKKHGFLGSWYFPLEKIEPWSGNCALCIYFGNKEMGWSDCRGCLDCPIKGSCDGSPDSVWSIWGFTRNPEPMIQCLQKAQLKLNVELKKLGVKR